MNLSVIICTHNPRAEYLQRALDALRSQSLDKELWELIIIDNRSDQPVEGRFDVSWHPHGRILVEDNLGLTPARLRGIAESRSELLVFVDDDNILHHDYLHHALRISDEHPFLGAWGGNLIPEYETIPQEWAEPHVSMLALRKVEYAAWSNIPEWSAGTCPAGAGMCIRSAVAKKYSHYCAEDPRRSGMDRKGTSLISSGDLDMAFTSCDLGMGIGVFPQLSLIHIIPAARLNIDYLLRLSEANGISNVLLGSFRSRLPHLPNPVRRSFLGRVRNRLIDILSRKGKFHSIHKRFRETYDRGIRMGYEMLGKNQVR